MQQHQQTGRKCAKSALKQSDSVANCFVQSTGRCTGSSRETPDPYSNILCVYIYINIHIYTYKALRIRLKGRPSGLMTFPQSGRNIGYLGRNSIRITCKEKKTVYRKTAQHSKYFSFKAKCKECKVVFMQPCSIN